VSEHDLFALLASSQMCRYLSGSIGLATMTKTSFFAKLTPKVTTSPMQLAHNQPTLGTQDTRVQAFVSSTSSMLAALCWVEGMEHNFSQTTTLQNT